MSILKMANIIKSVTSAKVSPNFTFGDMLGVGVSKVVTERMLSRVGFVGNGSFRSGAIKTFLAVGLNSMSSKGAVGRIAKVTATGLAVDGVEDLITATMNKYMGKSISTEQDSYVI